MSFERPMPEKGLALRGLWCSDILPTLTLGLPLVGAQLAQMAINTTDVLMIGWLGPSSLAGAVLAVNVYIVFWFFGMGLAQAVIPLAAAARGRGAPRDVRRSVRMGLWVVACYCVPVWVILWFIEDILIWVGEPRDAAHLAGSYLAIMQWSMLPSLAVMALRSFLTVLGKTQVVLWATILAAVANAVFDYILIFGKFGAPQMGLQGAALASVSTNLVSFLLVASYVMRASGVKRYVVFGRLWRSDWVVFRQILRVGWPIGATLVAEGSLFSAASLLMGWLGTMQLAAHGIAMQCASIAFMVPLGLSQAGMTRIGVALGRRDKVAIGRAGWTAFAIGELFELCSATLFWIMPYELVSLFLDLSKPESLEVAHIAAGYLLVAAVFQIFDGAQVMGASMLRGLGDTVVPFIMAAIGYWIIGISLAFGLAFGLGFAGYGIWWGLAAGLASTAVMTLWRFSLRERLGLVAFPDMKKRA